MLQGTLPGPLEWMREVNVVQNGYFIKTMTQKSDLKGSTNELATIKTLGYFIKSMPFVESFKSHLKVI